MFSAWKLEKATANLVDEAQDLADKLAQAKPHVVESHAAAARFWAAFYLSTGQDLHDLMDWPPASVVRFTRAAQTKIAALRKQRAYESSDGLAIWLHTARAVTEPRVAPVVRDIWQRLMAVGPNADAMAQDLMQDAGLAFDEARRVPKGFDVQDDGSGSA